MTRPDAPNAPRSHACLTGSIRWFDSDRGYGFITPDPSAQAHPLIHANKTPDVFVHFKHVLSIPKTLFPEDRVSFEPRQSAKGIEAINVLILARSHARKSVGDIPPSQARSSSRRWDFYGPHAALSTTPQ